VPVEQRVLSSNVVTRGTGRFGLPQRIAIAPSLLKASPGLIASLPLRNAQLEEGAVMLAASGRPVFVLQGAPASGISPPASRATTRQLEEGWRARLQSRPVDGSTTGRRAPRWPSGTRRGNGEPFGPTWDQLAALYALSGIGVMSTRRLTAAAAAAAAALAVASARATAEHHVRAAAADLAAKKADWRRLAAENGTPLAVESERAKAEYADTAAAAAVAAQVADRALIVLDPRQPETARAAADAKLAVARAAAEKIKLEGRVAILVAEREAKLAAEQLGLSEAAVRSARLEGEKVVQAALDAQKVAELDARLTAARANRLGVELEVARRKLGVQVPVDEIVFVPVLPVRVEEVTAVVAPRRRDRSCR
jgi:hypothetical protein